MICSNLYRQRRCKKTAQEVTKNTMLDLFYVRPEPKDTAGASEVQEFIS
jgi:hypothetical protein